VTLQPFTTSQANYEAHTVAKQFQALLIGHSRAAGGAARGVLNPTAPRRRLRPNHVTPGARHPANRYSEKFKSSLPSPGGRSHTFLGGSMNNPEGTFVPGPIMPAVLSLLLASCVSTQAQSQASDSSPKPTLRTPGDITQALRACYIPPPAENTYHGMRITLRLTFNRKGEVLGKPHITYATLSAPEQVQAAYRRAILDSVSRCTPLTFAPELGETFAGQPYYVRFIDSRARP
jgi:hypothetical protein